MTEAILVADEDITPQYSSAASTKSWGRRLRQKTKDLVQQVDTAYMDLARCLWTVYDIPVENDKSKGPIYRAWGHASFQDYVTDELEMEPKKAQRLKRIWYVVEVQLRLPDETKKRVAALGFAKVRELVRVINKANTGDWLDRAEKLTYRELLDAIKPHVDGKTEAEGAAQPSLPEGEDTATTAYSESEAAEKRVFGFYPEQAKTVNAAIERAKQLSGSNKDSNNIDLVCQNFLATNDFGNGDRTKELEKYLRNMERALKIQLIAYDPVQQEVIYGFDVLTRIVGWEDDS